MLGDYTKITRDFLASRNLQRTRIQWKVRPFLYFFRGSPGIYKTLLMMRQTALSTGFLATNTSCEDMENPTTLTCIPSESSKEIRIWMESERTLRRVRGRPSLNWTPFLGPGCSSLVMRVSVVWESADRTSLDKPFHLLKKKPKTSGRP